MSSHQYKNVKGGQLKLKGRTIFKADKSAKKKAKASTSKVDTDAVEHGGWWRIIDDSDFRGGIEVAIEAGDFSRSYLAALDNGTFTLGSRHFNELEPYPEEQCSLVKPPDDTKFSLKTGFGRYVGVGHDGQLVATSEAVGQRERFEAVFAEGKCAIQAVSSGLFIRWHPNAEGQIFASSKTASDKEFVNIRTTASKYVAPDHMPAEDSKNSAECEESYIKMYQHSRNDLTNRMISFNPKDKSAVRQAKNEGTLHETLLNRRMKLKSDKYC